MLMCLFSPGIWAAKFLSSSSSLETVSSLNKESRLLNIHFSEAIIVFGDKNPNAPNAMISRLK